MAHYKVINVETGKNHGIYSSIEQARGCVSFDKLNDWEIWDAADCCVDASPVYMGLGAGFTVNPRKH